MVVELQYLLFHRNKVAFGNETYESNPSISR
jgi:hypothetical protein